MAKFLILVVALVAGVGFVEAHPVLGLLGSGTAQNQVTGVLGGGLRLGEGLGLGGGLDLGLTDQLLSLLEGAVRTASVAKIQSETEAGARACTEAGARAVMRAKNSGATREQAKAQAIAEISEAVKPVVYKVVLTSAEAAVEAAYGVETQGPSQQLGSLGRK